MANHTNREAESGSRQNALPGWFLSCVLLVATAIGGSLFSHESRISKNEVSQARLDRLETKVDRVLEILRVEKNGFVGPP